MGRVHSIETMGLMDGPGIRMVVFLQGCPIRCLYCHNPDSQAVNAGEEMDSKEIIEQARRLKPYFERSGGGVTISGGEPLMQPAFLIELLKGLQKEGHCTVVDTSGYGDPKTYDEILKYTNLVILDLKHYDPELHKKLIGATIERQQPFLDALYRNKTRLWVRHVMVPGWSDNEKTIPALTKRIEKLIPQIENAEILPYHLLGVEKYKSLNRKYPLEGVPAMDKRIAKECERQWRDLIRQKREEGGINYNIKKINPRRRDSKNYKAPLWSR